MAVVEGGHQFGLIRQQHSVAEYIAAHVADTDHCERLRLAVDAKLPEVAFDGFPGTPGGDPHRLVVVSDRAARGERIAEPEVVLRRNRVGQVAEGGSALVRCDHEVAVVAIPPNRPSGRHHLARHSVVGQIE